MKEKIGIAFLILLNAGFIYLLLILPIFGYGMINGHHGLKAAETANHVAENLIGKAAILSFTALVTNYVLFKILLQSKRSIIGSILVTLIGILISIPFFLREKQSFIEHQHSQIMLSDYIDTDSIAEVFLFRSTDTIPIRYHREFFQIIGTASYRESMWKYQKQLKILIRKTDGTKDSIFSNGNLFEFKGTFFKAEENPIDKYLRISKEEIRSL